MDRARVWRALSRYRRAVIVSAVVCGLALAAGSGASAGVLPHLPPLPHPKLPPVPDVKPPPLPRVKVPGTGVTVPSLRKLLGGSHPTPSHRAPGPGTGHPPAPHGGRAPSGTGKASRTGFGAPAGRHSRTGAASRVGRAGTASGGRHRGGAVGRGRLVRHPGAGSHDHAAAAGAHPGSRSAGGILNQIGHLLPIPLPVPDWSKPIILILVLLALGLGIRAQINSRRARRLARHQRRLVADMDSMQAALVPAIPSRVGDLQVSAAYEPADGPGAGGDFYDAFALDDGRVAIILGDVSGHGRAALTHAVRMRYTLRAYVEAGLEPRAALRLAGSVLAPAEGDLFTTVAIAIYDKHAAALTYATAGHPIPLTLGGPALEPVSTCASPALGWGVPTGRRQTTIPFSKGMSACFFSDGLTEARTDDGLLGRARLAGLFAALGESGTASALLAGVRRSAREIRDDMAACAIEATSGNAVDDVSTEELEVSLKQLESGEARRFLKACGVAPDKMATLAEQGCSIAREHGVAVFKVRRSSLAVRATVSAPKTLGAAGSEATQNGLSGQRFPDATPTPTEQPVSALPAWA